MCRHSEELAFFALQDWLRLTEMAGRPGVHLRLEIESLSFSLTSSALFPFPSFLFITISTTTLRLFTSQLHFTGTAAVCHRQLAVLTLSFGTTVAATAKNFWCALSFVCVCVKPVFYKLRRLKLGDSLSVLLLLLFCVCFVHTTTFCHNCRSNEFKLYYRQVWLVHLTQSLLMSHTFNGFCSCEERSF